MSELSRKDWAEIGSEIERRIDARIAAAEADEYDDSTEGDSAEEGNDAG